MKIYSATKYFKRNTWSALARPASAPYCCCNRANSASLDLVRDLKGLFKFRGRGIFPREFPFLIVVLVIRNNCISKHYLRCQSKQLVILLAGSKESNWSWSQPVLLVATTETRLINTTSQFICNATTIGFKSSLVFLKVRYMCLKYRRISLRVFKFSQLKTRRRETPSVWRHNAITAWHSGPVFLCNLKII